MVDCCLHLLCPIAVEERVLDTLLTLGETGIFASSPANAHGFAHGLLSAQEQVSGRSSASLVHLLLGQDQLTHTLDVLKSELISCGVRYWITPVIQQGEFK